MELNTLDDLYYAKDIKEKTEENPFELSRFLVLFFRLYNSKTFHITRTVSSKNISDQITHRVTKLKTLLDTTRLTMPDIESLIGHIEYTPSTEIKISECNVVDGIVTLHTQQVSHELIISSLQAGLKFENELDIVDEDKIEDLKSEISVKTDQRMMLLNYLKNIGESLENHINSNLEEGLFSSEFARPPAKLPEKRKK
jgi:hypothetical protein